MTKRHGSKNKKPTMTQVKDVINTIINEMNHMQNAVNRIDTGFTYYLKFKEEEEKFSNWIQEEAKRQVEAQNEKEQRDKKRSKIQKKEPKDGNNTSKKS